MSKHKILGLFRNAKETREYPAGSNIFNQGDPGAEMFGVVSGEVEIRSDHGIVDRLHADDVFGEMAIVDESPRSGTAVATQDTVLAVIDRHRFLFLVQETPTFALQVMSVIADRLRSRM